MCKASDKAERGHSCLYSYQKNNNDVYITQTRPPIIEDMLSQEIWQSLLPSTRWCTPLHTSLTMSPLRHLKMRVAPASSSLNLDVLSVTSTQYKVVLDTIRTGGPRFVFEDEEIPICSTPYCCAFITMNPGYTGRYELPESVKTLILYRLSKALLLSPEHHYDWKLYLLPSPPPPHPCTKPFWHLAGLVKMWILSYSISNGLSFDSLGDTSEWIFC